MDTDLDLGLLDALDSMFISHKQALQNLKKNLLSYEVWCSKTPFSKACIVDFSGL